MTTAGRFIVLMVAGMSLLAGTGTTQARQVGAPRSLEEAVLAVHAEMTRAGEAMDVDRLFSFMLDTGKGSVIQNGVFMATREEALRRVKGNLGGISKVAYRWNRQHVTVLAPDVALLTAEGESVATTAGGEVFSRSLAQTVVFVLREGHWKALHAHQSSPQVR